MTQCEARAGSGARATKGVVNVKRHEAEYLEIAYGMDTNRDINVKTPPTLAEDNAFMKKMRFDDMNKEELRKLYRIAQDGLKVRSALDKQLAKLRVHEYEKKQTGTINNGLKYTEIFKRGRELLETIREGNQ